jgi:zinc transport system substrate-binding protein
MRPITSPQRNRALPGFFAVLMLATSSLVAGCAPQQPQAETTLGVAVTIPPVADFVNHVGGDLVEVTLMVPAGASPHTYEPTPGQLAAVGRADVYAKVGSGVEFELAWLGKLLGQNSDIEVIDCSSGIEIIDGDPHIWNSPANAGRMVENIVEGLSAVDPAHAGVYRENGDAYRAELSQLHDYVVEQLAGATERHFLVYHPSFAYFATEYDLIQLAIEEEGKTTTPQTLQQIIDLARQYNLHYVFVEPQFATAEAESVAEAIGGETMFIDPLPSSYIPNMRSVAAAISLELE